MILTGKFQGNALLCAAIVLGASPLPAPADSHNGVKQINLVSDLPGVAHRTDPNLVNPWGLTFVFGDLAVADNHAGVATFYEPNGRPDGLVLPIPAPGDPTAISAPTDLALNESSSAFKVQVGNHSVASRLIFVTEDGT